MGRSSRTKTGYTPSSFVFAARANVSVKRIDLLQLVFEGQCWK